MIYDKLLRTFKNILTSILYMGVFDKVLRTGESLFKNEVALSYDFMPKNIPYRENQQHQIARCIKPLFNNMSGRHVVVYGLPGVGKTIALKQILSEIEEETDEIVPIYINCWKKNTTFKIFVDICHQLGYKFTQNKRTEELFDVIKKLVNTKSAVFVFDEIDKCDDFDFMYSLLEDIYKKTIIGITNYKSWISSVDERIMSRFMPEQVAFNPYNAAEIEGILKTRIGYAFVSGIWDLLALSSIVSKTTEMKDVRTGLYLLKESGLAAEDRSSKKIEAVDVDSAIAKMQDFKIKKVSELEDDSQIVLDLIKNNSPAKIGDVYKMYQENGGTASYKTFQRRVEKLHENKFIATKKVTGGAEGTTTFLYYDTATRQLSDFQ
jgi:cell division control protein 6